VPDFIIAIAANAKSFFAVIVIEAIFIASVDAHLKHVQNHYVWQVKNTNLAAEESIKMLYANIVTAYPKNKK
jgi:hypothetical protein